MSTNKPHIESPFLTFQEAAQYLRVTPDTITAYTKRGVGGVQLKTVWIGGQQRITRAACDQFVAERTAAVEGQG